MFWKPDIDLYPTFLRARVRRGKGIGKGLDYKPWHKNSDVPSRGTSSCVIGVQVDRHYDILSELEVTYSVSTVYRQRRIHHLQGQDRKALSFDVEHNMRTILLIQCADKAVWPSADYLIRTAQRILVFTQSGPFAGQLCALAKGYQSKAILNFVKRYLERKEVS